MIPATLNMTSYADVRPLLKAGDVVAIGGTGPVSALIKLATWSSVSHVGIISHCEDSEDNLRVLVTESTNLNGFSGVSTSPLSTIIKRCNGNLWILPIAEYVRKVLDVEALEAYLNKANGKKYDFRMAIRAGSSYLFGKTLLPARKDDTEVFCSELVLFALEAGGFRFTTNASVTTPIALCRTPGLFQPTYFQLVGKPCFIKGYNGMKYEQLSHFRKAFS